MLGTAHPGWGNARERAVGGEPGGLLYLDRQLPQSFMLDLGSNTRITGLWIEGYDPTYTSDPLAKQPDRSTAIHIGGTYYLFTLYAGPTCDGNYNQHFGVHGTGPDHYGGDAVD